MKNYQDFATLDAEPEEAAHDSSNRDTIFRPVDLMADADADYFADRGYFYYGEA